MSLVLKGKWEVGKCEYSGSIFIVHCVILENVHIDMKLFFFPLTFNGYFKIKIKCQYIIFNLVTCSYIHVHVGLEMDLLAMIISVVYLKLYNIYYTRETILHFATSPQMLTGKIYQHQVHKYPNSIGFSC